MRGRLASHAPQSLQQSPFVLVFLPVQGVPVEVVIGGGGLEPRRESPPSKSLRVRLHGIDARGGVAVATCAHEHGSLLKDRAWLKSAALYGPQPASVRNEMLRR